jgi:nicotinate phosphoribosyltransferase
LIALSKSVRQILDGGGLSSVAIFASGGLDEDSIATMLKSGAPIDGFGIGTSLTTSSDVPAVDCAYKLQEYAGAGRRKHSAGKATWPGRKQVWRRYDADGRMAYDVLSLEDDRPVGEPLLRPVMRHGRRLAGPVKLGEMRAHAVRELSRLPAPLRELAPRASYRVELGESLVALAAAVDQRLAQHQGGQR